MADWPSRIESAPTAAATLNEAYPLVDVGRLDPPTDEDAFEARRVLGSKSWAPPTDDGEGPRFFGGPTWPPRCALPWSSPRYAAPALPPRVWIVDAPTPNRFTGGGVYLRYADEDADPDVEWLSAAVDGPQSDERDLVGVIGPPYGSHPAGAFSAALAVMVCRDVAARDVSYADSGEPDARMATGLRREAADLLKRADQVEALISAACSTWLPLLARCLPRESSRRPTSPTPVVPASLRVR